MFEFQTTYSKDFGSITLQGELVYLSEESKKILKDWNKNKRLPVWADAEVRNFLFRKCLTILVNLTEEMQMPPPLAFPLIVPETKAEEKEDKQKYIG